MDVMLRSGGWGDRSEVSAKCHGNLTTPPHAVGWHASLSPKLWWKLLYHLKLEVSPPLTVPFQKVGGRG